MRKEITNKKDGFIELIILIIIALVLMNYYGITVTGAFNWFISLFRSVLR